MYKLNQSLSSSSTEGLELIKFREKEMGERFELKEIQKLEGHTDKVWSVVWNPVAGTDGTPAILASCSSDKSVRIWKQNPTTRAFYCMATFEEGHTVRSCSWSPDGNFLAIASYDGTTSIWDKIENCFKNTCNLEGHMNEVKSVSWNASGALISTCSSDSLYIWGFEAIGKYECVAELEEEEYTQDVEMVQWHPFQDILFSCGNDSTIKVWAQNSDYAEWTCGQTLDHENNGHLSKVCSISFNATGDKMVTSSADLSIKVWGAERMQSCGGYGAWQLLCNLLGYHKRTVFSVHWSSKGIIASGAADDAICLFVENQDGLSQERSKAMYKLLLTKEKAHETDVNSEQWGPKEKREAMYKLLSTKGKAHEMDVDSVQWAPQLQERWEAMYKLLLTKEKDHETEVNSVQWGPKEIKLLASSSDNGSVKIWELTPRQ